MTSTERDRLLRVVIWQLRDSKNTQGSIGIAEIGLSLINFWQGSDYLDTLSQLKKIYT